MQVIQAADFLIQSHVLIHPEQCYLVRNLYEAGSYSGDEIRAASTQPPLHSGPERRTLAFVF